MASVAINMALQKELFVFVRDMLGDGGQRVGGGEDLEVAVDPGVEARAVDDDVGRALGGYRAGADHDPAGAL